MAWLGPLCRVLAVNRHACGERRNKARLTRWLGHGNEAHTVAWAQAMQAARASEFVGGARSNSQDLRRSGRAGVWCIGRASARPMGTRGREVLGSASTGRWSARARVSCWSAWAVARLWPSCVPESAQMCSDVRHARGGGFMRK